MTLDQQRAFAEALMAAVKDIPVNHGIEPQVMDALDEALGGKLTASGLKTDIGTLLSYAFDINSLRTREHVEEMEVRTRQWQNDIAARKAGEPAPKP